MESSPATTPTGAQANPSGHRQHAPKPDSPLRLGILLLVLAACVGALAYDYLVAKPGSEAASKKIRELAEARNQLGFKAGSRVQSEDIQKELGRSPSWVERTDTYTIEWYCWWGKFPLLSSRRHYIPVLFVGNEPRHYSTHHLNGSISDEELPDYFQRRRERGEPLELAEPQPPSGAPAMMGAGPGMGGGGPGPGPGMGMGGGGGGLGQKGKGQGKGKGGGGGMFSGLPTGGAMPARPGGQLPNGRQGPANPAGDSPAQDSPAPEQPAADQPASAEKPAEKPADDNPDSGDKKSTDKPAEDKPASEVPAEKPAEE